MDELARKFMRLRTGGDASGTVPTAIFGTAGQLSRSLDTRERVRIGLWPLVSGEDPHTAMGLMNALAFLLEQWRDIRVYRIFAQLEGEPDAYTWSLARSQFGVDDWQLEPLDENAAVWGTLARDEAGQWVLTLELENDLDEREQQTFTYAVPDVAGLVNVLPQAAADIAQQLESTSANAEAYAETQASDETLKPLLHAAFDWQIKLIMALWGQAWPDAAEMLNRLTELGKAVGDDFGAWLVGHSTAHAMLPGYGAIAQEISEFGKSLVANFPDSAFPAVSIALGFFNLGRANDAYDVLENAVAAHPESVSAWSVLALLYGTGGRLDSALETYQSAIAADAVNRTLYTRYAALLTTMDANNLPLHTFVLIDPEEYDDGLALWEAIEAYEEALSFDPENITLLQNQLGLFVELGEEESLWPGFEKLVTLDKTGEAVRNVADLFYNVEDVEPAVAALKRQIAEEPQRHDLYVNLAVVYLNTEQEEDAVIALEQAQDMTDNPDAMADIERLLLAAADPEFEARMGEIMAIVDAGNAISVDDADFLEEALESAPSLSEAYVALGKTYVVWGETQDALDILMDGHDQLPQDPDIIEALARVLWDSGEHDLAFDYLNKGIAANPRHVPLLALTGVYLFEDDQEDAARTYLIQAESIAPRHPSLAKARAEIAEMISKRGD
ncbi:MAG: hypothetical protein OHK0046_27150 [Anaerolineae bacterium]